MTQPIICPECGSDDLAFFTKRNQYRCGCGHQFEPVAVPPQPMRIFLSYGHDRNEELVLRIKSDLEALGHDVWLDREKIKFADDWRRAITDGIHSSDWMFSFLSKYSIRNPGVCLDELGIALGTNGEIIQTILVESESEVSPPVSVSHLQWLDMHDWHKRQQDDQAEFADWYTAKFAEIRRVLESETNQRFAGEIELLSQKLKPVTMDAFTARLLEKGFSGRQWLVDELDEWLQQERGRAFILTGEPGVGKSAFAAWLSHYNKAEVLAAVFMRYNQPQSCNPVRVIQTLAFQLASRLPDYRKQLIHLAEIDNLADKNESELFSYLLTEPLRLCIAGNRGNGIILIDALDDASAAGSGVAELLARHAQELPSWLRIVATTRPEPRLLSVLSDLHPHKLDADDQRNRQDISGYLQQQLAAFNPAAETIDAIVDKSEGIFLYAEQVTLQVLDLDLSLERIDEFPVGLSGIYTQYFQRQFPDVDRYHETTGRALQVLLAAREPLTREELASVLGWDETTTHRQLLSLGSLFPEVGGKIQPFHRSLGEWLTAHDKAGDYFVSLRDGHVLLATAGWNRLKKLLAEEVIDPDLDYAALYTGVHLYAGGHSDELLKEMVETVVERVNGDIAAYGEVLTKLITEVTTHEDYAVEKRFRALLQLIMENGRGCEIATLLHLQALQLRQTGYGGWSSILYETVRHILVEMTQEEPERIDLQCKLSLLYKNIGDIYEAQGSDRALEVYRKALKISEKLVDQKPEDTDLRRVLLTSYNSLGRWYKVRDEGKQALEMYQKGLLISKELVAQNPEHIGLHRELSISYNNIGNLYNVYTDKKQALEMYQKGLQIVEKLVVDNFNHNGLQHDLSVFYNNIGELYELWGDNNLAQKIYQKALQIDEMLVVREPERTDFKYILSGTYNHIGSLYQACGASERALEMYLNALQIVEDLIVQEPERFDLLCKLSAAYDRIGSLYQEQGENIRTLEMYQKGLKNTEKLIVREPENMGRRRELFVSYNRIADLYKARGDDERALEIYRKGLRIREELVAQEPESMRTDLYRKLSMSYNNCGLAYKTRGNSTQALEMYQKGLLIMKKLALQESENIDFQRMLSIFYNNIGCLNKLCGNSEQALDMYQKGLLILTKLVTRESVDIDLYHELFLSSQTIGDIYEELGENERALSLYRKSLLIVEKLLVQEPENTDFKMDLVLSCWSIFLLCPVADESYWLKRAYSVLHSLKKQGVSDTRFKKMLSAVERELAKQ